MLDNLDLTTCCLVDRHDERGDDVAITDPEAFDCESCEYRQRLEQTTDHDRLCLRLHHQLAAPVVRDLSLTRLVFELERPKMTADEAASLIDKLQIVHNYAQQRAALQNPASDKGDEDLDG